MNENMIKENYLNKLNVSSLMLTQLGVFLEYSNFRKNKQFFQVGCDAQGNFLIKIDQEIVYSNTNAFLTLCKYKELINN